MKFSPKALFCGPPTLSVKQLFAKVSGTNIFNWLDDKGAIYTHKTRVAIKLALELLNIGRGDEVLVPSYNCGTEIDVLLASGICIEPYRIDRNGLIDFEDLAKRLTEKTKAIYVTHYFGFLQPLEKLRRICDQNGMYIIEDSALSLLSNFKKQRMGSVGDVSVYNFPKVLPVPDGGAIVINKPELKMNKWQLKQPSAVKIFRNLLPFAKRGLLRASAESLVYPVLWNILKKRNKISNLPTSEFPDMPASYYYDEKLSSKEMSRITKYLLVRLDIPDIIAKRRRNFKKYLSLLLKVKAIQPLYNQLPEGICPLYFPVIITNRYEVCKRLNVLSICAIEWWAGYHRGLPWQDYPEACYMKDHLLVLPVHQQLEDKHIEYIAEMFKRIVSKVGN